MLVVAFAALKFPNGLPTREKSARQERHAGQGESMTQVGRAWYDVSVHPKVGRKKTVLSAIRNKRGTEWFAEQIKQRIGLRDG